MRVYLENETVKVEIETFGAEIKSLVKKATGQEYMWCANPAYWGKTAPFLFPFIGKLVEEKYTYEGKVYPALVRSDTTKLIVTYSCGDKSGTHY